MKIISSSTFCCCEPSCLKLPLGSITTCCCRRSIREIRVVDDGREVTATFEERRWVFPSGDCRLLPVANTTSELLAAFIGSKLLSALGDAARNVTHIRVELDECDGQIGVWEGDPKKAGAWVI